MSRDELLKMKAQIAAEAAAVDTLLARLAEPVIKQRKALVVTTSNPRSIYDTAEQLIKRWPGNFMVSDIAIAVFMERKKGSAMDAAPVVSQVVNKLRNRTPSEIAVVQEGKGSRSGTYRYIKPI